MKKMLKSFVLALAATATGAMAGTDATVKVTKFHQSYPYSGKATVEYTVATSATLPANAVAEITISTDDASATFKQKGVMAGANTNVIDFASSFGGALVLTNASFVVTLAEDLGGVQLWENGPYWAECNVGAEKPEDCGYYFWWGDTEGYTHNGSEWVSVKNGTSISFTPYDTEASTYPKSISELQSEGWIDSAGYLVEAHDAATAHLGAPWRMPTDAEFAALISNCTTTWITTNGVSGRLVTGKGAYADRSIFLPAVGLGYESSRLGVGSDGLYWSSSPKSDDPGCTWRLSFYSGGISQDYNDRYLGKSIRPVRGSAE